MLSRLTESLLTPAADESDGYVPTSPIPAALSCTNTLTLPYSFDAPVGIATIPVREPIDVLCG